VTTTAPFGGSVAWHGLAAQIVEDPRTTPETVPPLM
jgi:hypothetical protein